MLNRYRFITADGADYHQQTQEKPRVSRVGFGLEAPIILRGAPFLQRGSVAVCQEYGQPRTSPRLWRPALYWDFVGRGVDPHL